MHSIFQKRIQQEMQPIHQIYPKITKIHSIYWNGNSGSGTELIAAYKSEILYELQNNDIYIQVYFHTMKQISTKAAIRTSKVEAL